MKKKSAGKPTRLVNHKTICYAKDGWSVTCTLMHKNIPVVKLEIDSDNGYIDKIGMLHNPDHLPIGTTGLKNLDKNKPNRAALNDWWLGLIMIR